MEACQAKCQSPFNKYGIALMTLLMLVYGMHSLTQSCSPSKKSPLSTGSRATDNRDRKEASSFKTRMGHGSNPHQRLPNKLRTLSRCN